MKVTKKKTTVIELQDDEIGLLQSIMWFHVIHMSGATREVHDPSYVKASENFIRELGKELSHI